MLTKKLLLLCIGFLKSFVMILVLKIKNKNVERFYEIHK